ncbi:MAG TPA: exodeoxyribonuclease VII large subunit, partial [Hymenobacter sp.]
GVGHETDFTIADFCADVRAPTPTAAAELCARPRADVMDELASRQARLIAGVERKLGAANQRLDRTISKLNRPLHFLGKQQSRLDAYAQKIQHARRSQLKDSHNELAALEKKLPESLRKSLSLRQQRQHTAEVRLDSLSPRHVLSRGYAWLADTENRPITAARQTQTGQSVRATLADGQVDLTVSDPRLI